MNRRTRRHSITSKREEGYLRYLKPGALAQLRDSKINARSHRSDSHLQICLYRTVPPPSPSSSSSPLRSPTAGPPQIGTVDGFPCFVGRIYGPRCPQRKKLMAAKSMFFLSSSPSSPVSDAPDPIIDVFSTDFLVAH